MASITVRNLDDDLERIGQVGGVARPLPAAGRQS